MAVQLTDGTNANLVDATSKGILVQNPKVVAQAGYVVALSETDAGSLTGSAVRVSPRVSTDRRMQVGMDTLLFHHMFGATAQNTAVWKYLSSTMTAAQSGGFLQLNANSTATTTTGTSMQSWRYVSLGDRAALQLTFSFQINTAVLAGQVIEFGLFIPTPTTAPTEGVYLRLTSSGLVGVLNYNGTEQVSGNLPGTISTLTTYDMSFVIGENQVDIYMAGVLLGTLTAPGTSANIFLSESLPIAMQMRNSGAVSGTQCQPKFSCVSCYQQDINATKPWPHQMAGNGFAYQGTEGGTMGQTSNWTNNTAPTAVALTNTTAAFVGVGGIAAVLPTLAVGSDGILFSYQNPLGSVTQPARLMIVTGLHLQGAVTVALTGGPVTYVYAVAFGSTAVSQATTESGSFSSGTTKAPRRVPCGMETYAASAAVGVLGSPTGIRHVFSNPIVVNPGEFLQIIARNVGVVTSAGAITLEANFDYYLE